MVTHKYKNDSLKKWLLEITMDEGWEGRFVDMNDEVVTDGTGAMRAYHELMFGTLADKPDRRERLEKLLLQYCELDTMAMVIIWKYWKDEY